MVWYSTSITSVLNTWNQQGVFSYVLPFLIIFAVVYAILSKTKLFENNRGVNAIIALALGLISLYGDYVPSFFATIFPRMGVAIAIFIVAIILIGFFYQGDDIKKLKWIGWVLGIGAIVWALTAWNWWGDQFGVGYWLQDNFWALITLGLIIGAIVVITREPKS